MISYTILEYYEVWSLFVAAIAFSGFLKSAKFLFYFALLWAILLDPERESLLEIGYMAYLVLGEGVCNILYLIHAAAYCLFFALEDLLQSVLA